MVRYEKSNLPIGKRNPLLNMYLVAHETVKQIYIVYTANHLM